MCLASLSPSESVVDSSDSSWRLRSSWQSQASWPYSFWHSCKEIQKECQNRRSAFAHVRTKHAGATLCSIPWRYILIIPSFLAFICVYSVWYICKGSKSIQFFTQWRNATFHTVSTLFALNLGTLHCPNHWWTWQLSRHASGDANSVHHDQRV